MWQPQDPLIPRPAEEEQRQEPVPPLTCPLCGSQSFDREKERTDTRWGMFTHVKTLMICRRCKHILHFQEGVSIFDFD